MLGLAIGRRSIQDGGHEGSRGGDESPRILVLAGCEARVIRAGRPANVAEDATALDL